MNKLHFDHDKAIKKICVLFVLSYFLVGIIIHTISSKFVNPLLLCIFFLFLAITFHRITKLSRDELLGLIPFQATLRLLLFLFFLGSLANLFATFSISNPNIEILLLWFFFGTSIICVLIYLIEFSYGLIVSFKKLDHHSAKEYKKTGLFFYIGALILTIIFAYTLPDMIFGFLYNIITVGNKIFKSFNLFDYFYFSFVTHYALPLHSDAKIYPLVEFINNEWVGRIIEIIHINSCKLIELIVIGYLGNQLYQLFTMEKSTDKKRN